MRFTVYGFEILDVAAYIPQYWRMTMLELKQEVSRLSPKERRELNAFMIRLRHQTPAWKKMISKRMKAMDAGKKVSLEEVERRLARG